MDNSNWSRDKYVNYTRNELINLLCATTLDLAILRNSYKSTSTSFGKIINYEEYLSQLQTIGDNHDTH